VQAWPSPEGSRDWGSQIQNNWPMNVVRLSALRTGCLYLPGDIPGTYFCFRLGRTQDHSATGRIKSMKNSNDNIGNRTPKLPDFVKRIINIWFSKANFLSNQAPRSAGVQMIGTKDKLSSWSSNSTAEESDGKYSRTDIVRKLYVLLRKSLLGN